MAQKFELETSCSQHFLAYKKHSQGPAFVWIEFTDKVHSSFLLLVNKTAKKEKKLWPSVVPLLVSYFTVIWLVHWKKRNTQEEDEEKE